MQTLVIVESPAKAKTIEKYLGEKYKVLSSVGHIRDLATTGKGGLGIDVEDDFKPDYKFISGKKKVVNELLKEKKKSFNVLIATDPDREGEAIGWHLAESLELDINDNNRIVFNEITKAGVLKGIENVRKLDMDLVHSQEGRRMIDRIIGFKLSALLKKKIKVQSAGRVQSVALRMIVEREEEIQKFVPVEYWTITGFYQELELAYEKNDKKLAKEEIFEIFNKLEQDKKLQVIDIKETKKTIKAPKIFTTSTLQQTAVNRLSFNSKKTMMIAQKLYEGIDIGNGLEGLITYMRTDSTRISPDIEKTIYGFINGTYGKEYVGYYVQKKDKQAQDAHEGIRPTNVNNTPAKVKPFLTADEFKIYNLIWTRTVQALMKEAKTLTKTYILEHESKIKFKTSNTVDTFKGFKMLNETKEDAKEINLKLTESIEVDKFEKEQHFTQPKPRYTEARLIKELEENGVGRPSTYAAIIDILKKRNYVIVDKKVFIPTEDGFLVTTNLKNFFETFINVKYTSELESQLDEVAIGKKEELKLLNEFYNYFMPLLENANTNMEKIGDEPVGRDCPECGEPLVQRKSKYGTFVGCSNFPKCKYNEIKVEKVADCPNCEDGMIIEKLTKRGKVFYACNNFPKCKYAVWNKEDIGRPLEELQKEQAEKKKSKTKSKPKKTSKKK
ncbi:MAG: type I DNA topoisomerase [Mycoplasmatales bacterium]